MQGPDSDLWPAIAHEDQEWNWQSSAPCTDVAVLDGDIEDTDHLLTAIGRYTVENLILNAVHEIGEWLRFDGQRLFPTHLPQVAPLDNGDEQGNGAVQLKMTSVRQTQVSPVLLDGLAVNDSRAEALVGRLAACAAGPRFTHLPETTISFEAAGPVVQTGQGGGESAVWRSAWSTSTLEAASAPMEELIKLVGQDVHRALVFSEADRICRAFHVDGQRPWHLSARPHGAEQNGKEGQGEALDISVTYSSGSLTPRIGPPAVAHDDGTIRNHRHNESTARCCTAAVATAPERQHRSR
jgi:hypothetical protein